MATDPTPTCELLVGLPASTSIMSASGRHGTGSRPAHAPNGRRLLAAPLGCRYGLGVQLISAVFRTPNDPRLVKAEMAALKPVCSV